MGPRFLRNHNIHGQDSAYLGLETAEHMAHVSLWNVLELFDGTSREAVTKRGIGQQGDIAHLAAKAMPLVSISVLHSENLISAYFIGLTADARLMVSALTSDRPTAPILPSSSVP
jgi:hypothetical protein